MPAGKAWLYLAHRPGLKDENTTALLAILASLKKWLWTRNPLGSVAITSSPRLLEEGYGFGGAGDHAGSGEEADSLF